jgi:diacylglycerol kinase (ATP)
MRHRFYILTNPEAGWMRQPVLQAVVTALERDGATIERASESEQDIDATHLKARDAALSGRFDAVIVAGGDGTIRQAAKAVLGTGTAIGVIAIGTANVLAHELRLPREAEAIARMLREDPVTEVQCARANGEPFLLMAGAGFDGRVVAALNRHWKSRFGKLAYVGPVVGALVRPVDRLDVLINGARYDANWVVVANARHYGGTFTIAHSTRIDQPGLEAILFKATNRFMLLDQLVSLLQNRLDQRATRRGDIIALPCTRATVTAPTPVPVQIDGDVFGTLPLVVETTECAIRLITPQPGASNPMR